MIFYIRTSTGFLIFGPGLHEQQDEAAYEVPVQAGEDPLKTYASARQDLTLPG